MNVVVLMGNTTSEIEQKKIPNSGTTVVNFTLAVRNPYQKNDDGETSTDFVRCTAFGKTAEVLSQYVMKGQKISVEGRIRVRQWETDEGEKRTSTEVLVNQMHFAETKKDAGSQYGAQNTAKQRPQTPPKTELTPHDFIEDDDLPF